MKSFLSLLTLTISTIACINKQYSQRDNNDGLQIINSNTNPTNNIVPDANMKYIGFVDKFYFSKENEAYIELYFINDFINEDEYDKIVKLSDSMVYEDDENSRYKFSDKLSQRYFDLRGLSNIKIYDQNNNLYCNAEFVRVEYLNQNIFSSFIAVFKTEKKLNGDGFYGITNFNGEFEELSYMVSNDTIRTQQILTKLNEQIPYNNLKENGTHLIFSNNKKFLSIINSRNFAYITLTTENNFKVLYKSESYENITNNRIIPISKNGLPFILTRNVKPETDVFWDKLLIFDGTKYKPTKRQRCEITIR